MLVALKSACPVAHENNESAGYTALAMAHATTVPSLSDDLTAWQGFGGPGLLANPVIVGNTEPEVAANELARGIFHALEGGPQLSMTARELRGDAPRAALLDLAAKLVTRGHPSSVLGRGTHDAMASVNPLAVRQALFGFLRTPLSLEVVANDAPEQAAKVHQRLEALLSPFLDPNAKCSPPEAPALSGNYVLVEDQDGADAVLAFPIPLVQLPAAQAVAYLMNRPGGFLEQALHAEGLSTEATAAVLGARGGHAALFVALDADSGAVADATAQLRALIQRIAGGAITARHHADLEKHVRSLRPWSRWEQLFLEEPRPALVSLDELRRFAHSYLTEEKLVIVSAKRTE